MKKENCLYIKFFVNYYLTRVLLYCAIYLNYINIINITILDTVRMNYEVNK